MLEPRKIRDDVLENRIDTWRGKTARSGQTRKLLVVRGGTPGLKRGVFCNVVIQIAFNVDWLPNSRRCSAAFGRKVCQGDCNKNRQT